MTENDPQETFLADQRAAAQEAESRESTQWSLNVAEAESNVAMKRAHARRTEAYAQFLEALTLAFYTIILAGVLGGLYIAGRVVVGWFQ